VRETDEMLPETKASVEIRCDWDREIANRECRRADELKLHYPTVKQWRAAYLFALHFYNQTLMKTERAPTSVTIASQSSRADLTRPRFQSPSLTPDEEVQIICVIARDQIDAGNYDAACGVLKRWWAMGEWPKLEGLNSRVSADLLLTVGTLAGFVASARQVPRGQKHAEALLNGAIGLFEQLGSRTLSAEGRIELALCYEREGIFDLARATFPPALEALLNGDGELRRSALFRLAKVECQAGRLQVALERVHEANEIVVAPGPLHSGHYHLLLAAILQTLTTTETRGEDLDRALEHYLKAIDQWEAIGNHLYAAVGENNHGFLLVSLGRLDEAETHMVRARKLFDALDDKRRCAQVDDSLAHLHLAAGRFELAEQAAGQAVKTLETGGLEGFLAEALTTQGLVLCKLGRHREAKRILARAHQIADRCDDTENASIALLTIIEEISAHLDEDESIELAAQLDRFRADSQKASTIERIKNAGNL
jgi:tetratricopeptide (TPR) repeat protein